MEANRARLCRIVYENTFDVQKRYNIGTYKEKKLHIIMKKYFEPSEDYHEVPINGFIADICRDGVITEIETNGFSGLCPKLEAYTPDYHVNLVYPVAAKKYVSWIDPETSEISPRKPSPKKMGGYDLLAELVRILPFVKSENITFLAPLLEVDEYRLLDGWSHDRKRGSHRFERIPADILGIAEFSTDDDFRAYIPEALGDNFTVREFMKAAHIKEDVARAVIKVMLTRGVMAQSGKKGRSYLYKRT